MTLITNKSDKLTAVISSKGAELQSLKGRDGVERMWQGDPAFWANRAPVLFPVAGGFREDCYELDGVRYPMGKHGFTRNQEFEIEEAVEDQAVFLYRAEHEGFPFRYELRVRFTVAGAALKVDYAVSSQDDKPFYFSVGSHEAYATPEGIEDYEIVFDQEEDLDVSPLVGNLITHETFNIGKATRVLPLKEEYFAVDALVFLGVRSKGVELRSRSHGRTIRVDFPRHDCFMLWTKPHAGYICIEPWCNHPDFVDAPLAIDQKDGFMRLAPGETITRSHTITVG